MALTRFDIHSRTPYAEGRSFGDVGAYERLEAVAHYAVDPHDPANAAIVDLDRAQPADDGKVHFQGDVTMLVPADPARASGTLLLEVPNRGHRVALRSFNMAPFTLEATAAIEPGDGFLMARGWTVAWCGWQWDVPRLVERIGLAAPEVSPSGRVPEGRMQLRFQPGADTATLPLTDQHVGSIGRHRLIETVDAADASATLMVRDAFYGDAETLPRECWRFARDLDGAPVPDAGHVWLQGGFEAGRIYDLLYTPRECPVVGAGLLAVRDCATFLRHDPSAPTASTINTVIGEGISQCGRFLRTFLYFGLNADERGRAAFDGVLVHIAGGRRGEFNHRYGQPSVQPTPSFGHRFPFADDPQTDARTGRSEGLLDRQRAAGCLPRIVYTDTSSEYWRGDAALAHLDVESGGDVEPPAGIRRYLFSCTQHGPGALPFTNESVFGTAGANAFNVVDYRPLFRAALENLRRWIEEGEEPPASVYPRFNDGTASERSSVLERMRAIAAMTAPRDSELLSILPLDLGSDSDRGIARLPAKVDGEAYPAVVSAVDADGNETGGLAMPDVAVPVATHTGFNPRHASAGGKHGPILEYIGSTVPFPADENVRRECGDPRVSIAVRYRDRDDYLARVRVAAQSLVAQRYLLERDVDLCVDLAAERYDASLLGVMIG